MSKLLALFAILLVAPATAVLAQTTPSPSPAPTYSPRPERHRPDFGAMRKMMQQQMALHRQLRTKVLAALTPAHRALLESIIGQLVISDKPDPRAAVRKLDAALSGNERSAIVSAAQSFRSQMRTQLRTLFPRLPERPARPMPSPDAGRILLMTAFAPHHRFGMRPMGPFMRGFMHRGRFGKHPMRPPPPSATP